MGYYQRILDQLGQVEATPRLGIKPSFGDLAQHKGHHIGLVFLFNIFLEVVCARVCICVCETAIRLDIKPWFVHGAICIPGSISLSNTTYQLPTSKLVRIWILRTPGREASLSSGKEYQPTTWS